MKEIELAHLKNAISQIATLADFDELKKFIDQKLKPLFQFEHYIFINPTRTNLSIIQITSFSDSIEVITEKTLQQVHKKFMHPLIASEEKMQSVTLKSVIDKEALHYNLFAQAYKAGMTDLIFIPSPIAEINSYWMLFGSKKEFFNPHKLDLFNSIQTLLGLVSQYFSSLNDPADKLLRKDSRKKDHIEEETILSINENGTSITDQIIGDGAEIQVVKNLINQAAPTDTTILILGETGTGKELVAKAIHRYSTRREKLMITVNCAAIPEELIESELFGHEKGSFTGATERKLGKFELAHNSTVFLDEIGELPLSLQSKLLRVLQERVIERVGGQKSISVNVRIIAATNRNLQEEIVAGKFRSDLYYRLNVFPILLPALRERPYDLKALTNYFVAKFSKQFNKFTDHISQSAWHALHQYLWPGNVRELEHTIERSLLMNQGKVLKTIHFVSKSTASVISEKNSQCTLTLKEAEREYILRAIKQCNGRISGKQGAALLLGIPATTLFSKMEKLGIKKSLFPSEKTIY